MKCTCGQPATVRVTVSTGRNSRSYLACDEHEPRTLPAGADMVRAEPI
ncbi:hypothetical protein AB0M91_23655 [Micromonospora rifamycinica]